MIRSLGRYTLSLSGLALAGSLAAVPAGAEDGNVFTNLFKYGGTTVPPSQPKELQAAYCPTIDIPDGGAALRTMAGGTVRTQVSLGRVARECTRREDGSITVKVGVEARVLLGPAGSPGRVDVPVTVRIKFNDKVVTSRSERTTAVIEPGEAEVLARIVVDDLSVPPAMTADYEIEVSIGGKAGSQAKSVSAKPKRRKPVAAAAPAGGADPGQ